MIVRAASPRDFAWLYQRTGFLLSGTGKAIVAVDSRDTIRGMVGYDDWTPATVRMHIALDTPVAGRVLLRPAFQFPFLEVGVRTALAQIVSSNQRIMNLTVHLGFSEFHRVRGGWDEGADLIFMRMDRESCRYLSQRKAA